VVRATWEEFTAGMRPGELELVESFRALVMALDAVEERVSRTEVSFARRRLFAGAFTRSGRLEVFIDLLRQASHPLTIAVFPTTKQVWTHRLTIERLDQLDGTIRELIDEAYATVGPGVPRAR